MLVLSDSMLWWVQAILIVLHHALRAGFLYATGYLSRDICKARERRKQQETNETPIPLLYDREGAVFGFFAAVFVWMFDFMVYGLGLLGLFKTPIVGQEWSVAIWVWHMAAVVLYLAVLPNLTRRILWVHRDNRAEKRASNAADRNKRENAVQW